MAEMVPIVPLPPAPPALNFGGNNFDCWVMVGGFNLSTADVSTAMLALPKFADALESQFKLDKSLGDKARVRNRSSVFILSFISSIKILASNLFCISLKK